MTCSPEEVISSAELAGLKPDIATIDDVVESSLDTTVTKSGKVRNTLTGQLKLLGYQPPVTYAGSIAFTTNDGTKTVDEAGVIYAPLPSALPFTTSGTFIDDDDARFVVVQGVTGNNFGAFGLRELTLAQSVSLIIANLGDAVIISDRGDGIFDYALSSSVTENTFNIVQCTGVPTLSLVLRVGTVVNAKQFGALGDYVPSLTMGVLGTGTDDAPAINSAITYAKALKTGDEFKLIRLAVPAGRYLLSSGLDITGLEFGGDDLSTEFYLNPDLDFIGIASTGECWYKNFFIEGGWDGDRNPAASAVPAMRHQKLSGATIVFSGQFRVDNVWGQFTKGDFFQAYAFGYTNITKLTGRGLRANGLVVIGEQAGNASVTSTTLNNINMASCEYALRLHDTFAVQVNAVWENCRGLLIGGTSNRNLSFVGCYSEGIEAGFMPINFDAGATGLGLGVSGSFLNEGVNGTVQSFEGTGFRRILIASSTGEEGVRYEDDAPMLLNRVASNGDILEVQREGVSQLALRAEGGVVKLTAKPTGSQLQIGFTDSGDVERNFEFVDDSGPNMRPATDNAFSMGRPARRYKEAYINDLFCALPVSDPAVPGQFWNDSGTVKVSS